jgi:hypothetical protein
MSTLEALVRNAVQAAAQGATETADDSKAQAAAFLKQLSQAALTMASNSLMEAQDLMGDLEDDDE